MMAQTLGSHSAKGGRASARAQLIGDRAGVGAHTLGDVLTRSSPPEAHCDRDRADGRDGELASEVSAS